MVLPVQADPGALIQALLHMAIPAKRDVGPGGKGDQASQAKVENGRALCRREVRRDNPRVLTDTDVGMVPSPPPRVDPESETSGAEPERPQDDCGCDPGTTDMVAGAVGRRVFGPPPAALGWWNPEGNRGAQRGCTVLIFFIYFIVRSGAASGTGAEAPVDQSGQEFEGGALSP